MSSNQPPHHRRLSGFTLIELLVSITVLSIMLLFLGQAIALVSNIWINGIGLVDNYSKARNVMSIMDRDVQSMSMRPDLPAFVDFAAAPALPQPACAFYTNIQGQSAAHDRTVSLVQYQLSTSGTYAYSLMRNNYGMNFTTPVTPSIPAALASPTAPNPMSQLIAANLTAEPLANGVVLFQWQFVDGAGNFINPTTPATAFPYDYNAPSASTNPRAIVVSLLVLNNSAFKQATSAGLMTTIQGLFPAATLTNQTYSQYWNNILNPASGTFGSTLPMPVRSGLKVFQRYIPLPVVAP